MNEYILSLSYGKDSLACLEAIKLLGLPLDRIVHAEVWATDTIPADLPPMVEFKAKADKIIKERYGIEVEHVYAVRERESTSPGTSIEKDVAGKSMVSHKSKETGAPLISKQVSSIVLEKVTYEKLFYRKPKRRQGKEQYEGMITGFAFVKMPWCNSRLKVNPQKQIHPRAINKNIISYLGIAADEPERIARHNDNPNIILPLVEIGWDEAQCRKWCEENDLLSPIYTDSARGGCWFCHNQGINQLRLLRKNYPHLWKILLQWDADSPVSFKPDGHTVHDFDLRFSMEDKGLVPADRKFRWKMLER